MKTIRREQMLCLITLLVGVVLIQCGSMIANRAERNLTGEEMVRLIGGDCDEWCYPSSICEDYPDGACGGYNGDEETCISTAAIKNYNDLVPWNCDPYQDMEFCESGDYGACAYVYSCEYWSTCNNCTEKDTIGPIENDLGCYDDHGNWGTWE